MSAGDGSRAFSPKVMLLLIAAGLLVLAAMAALSVFAPSLRGGFDPRPHAQSPSAIGFRAVTILMRKLDIPAEISRVPAQEAWRGDSLLILTPGAATSAADLAPFAGGRLLIVLPKWGVANDAERLGFVRKVGVTEQTAAANRLLSRYARHTLVSHRQGVASPTLRAADATFAGKALRLSSIDQLQTVSGADWSPVLTDDKGGIVLARSNVQDLYLLADPDILNNQGLAKADNARAAAVILDTLRRGKPVRFDVTLAGLAEKRSLVGLMLRPPWLAATLCAVAAGLLMGLHGLARFGAPARPARDIALGRAALVANAAALVRLARREAEFAPAYLDLMLDLIARATGGRTRDQDAEGRAADLARRQGEVSPETLRADAAKVRTRHDLIAFGDKLYHWKAEITRGRH